MARRTGRPIARTRREYTAYAEYLAHIRACEHCKRRRQAVCGVGIELYEHWWGLQAKELATPVIPRPKLTVIK